MKSLPAIASEVTDAARRSSSNPFVSPDSVEEEVLLAVALREREDAGASRAAITDEPESADAERYAIALEEDEGFQALLGRVATSREELGDVLAYVAREREHFAGSVTAPTFSRLVEAREALESIIQSSRGATVDIIRPVVISILAEEIETAGAWLRAHGDRLDPEVAEAKRRSFYLLSEPAGLDGLSDAQLRRTIRALRDLSVEE